MLEDNAANNWKTWIRAFEFYAIAAGVHAKAEKVQCSLFMHVAGTQAQRVHANMVFESGDQDKITPLIKAFKDYCTGKENIIITRFKFNSHCQTSENASTYITALKDKVTDCEYGAMEDTLLRDRIVAGVKNRKLQNKLLQTANLTLDTCIEICQLSEYKAEQLQPKGATDVTQEVDYVQSNTGNRTTRGNWTPSWKSRASQPSRGLPTSLCARCGYDHKRERCPANGKTCAYCKKVGHFAKVCRKKPESVDEMTTEIPDPHNVYEEGTTTTTTTMAADHVDSLETDLFIGDIANNPKHGSKLWYKTAQVNGHEVIFKMDTGAEANLLPVNIYDTVKNGRISKSRCSLTTYSGHRITPVGEDILNVNGYDLSFQIVKNGTAILGKEACVELNLLVRVDTVTSQLIEQCNHTAKGLVRSYLDVFTGLGLIKTNTKIHVNPNITPSVDPPRRIPYAIREKVQAELQRMIKLGVIVEQHEPTEWVNSITIVQKPNKLRICLDPTKLNRAIHRCHFPTKTIEEVIASTSGAQYFTVLDAQSGYWQIQLDEQSSRLCTFNTPWGRYRYKRLPFGVKTAGDIFIREMQGILGNLPGVDVITDDILVYGATLLEHNKRLESVLKKARSVNLKFNAAKSKIAKTEVAYVGHVLTREGIKPDPMRIQAITDMPVPGDKPAVQRFLGMVGYVHKFIPHMSEIAKPLRVLLGKNVAWHWQSEQNNALENLKNKLKNAPVLQYYNVNKPTVIQVDACQSGLGAVLIQEGRPIAMASRALDSAQTNYAIIEKELLAICFGCQKFHDYIFGKATIIQSDHKPLVNIMMKPIHKLSARMQRMRMRLQNYDITVTHLKGTENFFADALSRAHSKSIEPKNLYDEECTIAAVSTNKGVIKHIQDECKKDATMLELKKLIVKGWPVNVHHMNTRIQQYYAHKNDLTTENDLIFKDNRVVIPSKLQPNILERLHETHMGATKSKQLARDTVFWPGINQQIVDRVARCALCQDSRNRQHAEPMISHPIPKLPFTKVGADLFEINHNSYLIVVDYYSKFPEVMQLENTSSHTVIKALKEVFARFGIPQQVVSDNGPQFKSNEYEAFAHHYGFCPRYSSPQYPKSNGQTERFVQTIKHMIIKCTAENKDLELALLNFRNTPIEIINASPAQLLMSRRLRSRLPVAESKLTAVAQHDKTKQITRRQKTQKKYYDLRAGSNYSTLRTGSQIKYQNHKGRWSPGTITAQVGPTGREYQIKNKQNNTITRNRTQLINTPHRRVATPIDHSTVPYRPNEHTEKNTHQRSTQSTSRYGRTLKPVVRFGTELS